MDIIYLTGWGSDMEKIIKPAGYIVVVNEGTIYGAGGTADSAWSDFEDGMASDGIMVLDDETDAGNLVGAWTRRSSFKVLSATEDLVEEVYEYGGHIAWETVGEVACTMAEFARWCEREGGE
jgi:hypothetical protein